MMRLLGNILVVDPLPLLSDLSLAARRPKRSSGAACPSFTVSTRLRLFLRLSRPHSRQSSDVYRITASVICTSKNALGVEKGRRSEDNQHRSRRGRPSVYAVNLGGHDEVVLMQSLDLLGLQRDRRIAPTEADVRMMAFSFREFTNLLNKGKRLPEITKPEAPLDAVSFLRQSPVWGLWLKDVSLLAGEWRYSPATGSTGFACKSFGHVACSSCQPSPAPRLANCKSDVVISAGQAAGRTAITAAVAPGWIHWADPRSSTQNSSITRAGIWREVLEF